ncbi:THO complex subunit 7 like [Dissostichus eleginoides]|uniref:THO complex subunit 7 like n=1 Tax=Dissostichus eleginoides TaxID=100907 RepID=A0AAD9FDF6_DISEL|nr:THO complex subunit 7 like [Dissostichus eleginoides]
MGAVTDDEVIRKRLLIDGDGAGDDRRINVLLKSFTKWCNSPGTPEEGFTQYQRVMATLGQCEFSMGKTLMVYDMNLREMENYEKIYTNIEQNITSSTMLWLRLSSNIQTDMKHLSSWKRLTKNSSSYAKLELRKKQFHVLLSTIQELQQTLENDEKSDNDDNQESPVQTGE